MTDAEMASAYLSGASFAQIAAANGRVYDFARRRVSRAGVVPRGAGESIHLAKRAVDAVKVTDALHELIDGLLLGDGHLEASRWGARLTLGQTEAHLPWLRQVQRELEQYGVVATIRSHTHSGWMTIGQKRFRRRKTYVLRTALLGFLKSEHARWYLQYVKRVPRDVRLTPTSIAHWYFGDGTVGCKGYHATFCTDGFTQRDVLLLIRRLKDRFGWRPLVGQRNRILLCKMPDRVSLVEMLRTQSIPRCFRHKLRLRLRYRSQVIRGPVETRLRTLRQQGWSYGRIAVELKLSKSGVADACQRLSVST